MGQPLTLVWSPAQEDHLLPAWQGDAIRATDVPAPCAGPVTHACSRPPSRLPNEDSRTHSG